MSLRRRRKKKSVEDEKTTESLVTEWAETTSWHGIGLIKSSKRFILKIFWSLVVILCFSQVVYQVVSFLGEFDEERPWLTRLSSTRRPGVGVEMPNITLCNFNPWNLTAIHRLGLTTAEYDFIRASMSVMTQGEQEYEVMSEEELRELEQSLVYKLNGHKLSTPDAVDKISMTCEQTFLACSWPNRDSKFDCCRHVMLAKHRGDVCMTLTLPPVPKDGFPIARALDTSYAARLVLDPSLQHSWGLMTTPFVGFEAHLNFAGNEQFHVKGPIVLSPASSSWIYMTLEQETISNSAGIYSYIYHPELPCVPEGKLHYIRGNYSLEACRQNCYAEMLRNQCRCVRGVGIIDNSEGLPICTPLDVLLCYHHFKQNRSILYHERMTELERCKSNCRPECNQKYIRAHVEVNPIVTDKALDVFLNSTLDPEKLNSLDSYSAKYVVLADISYADLSVKLSETVPKITIDGLLSNIGGVMGVWAGMSIITIIEALTFLLHSCFRFAKRSFSSAKISSTKKRPYYY